MMKESRTRPLEKVLRELEIKRGKVDEEIGQVRGASQILGLMTARSATR